jgi:PEP-CTERM putative exosortase interaction domain
VFFDNVNNGTGCAADNLDTAHVCAGATGTGTDGGDINTWIFHIDLNDALPDLTSAIDTNLRAVFLPNGILSPDFNNIPGTSVPGGGNDTPGVGRGGDTSVPEPTSLILLGSGLAYVGTRLRRRAE